MRPSAALVLIAALLAAPAAPALKAWTDPGATMCAMHGRNCTCPQACARDEHEHSESRPEPVSDVPACHRAQAAESKAAPSCTMRSCGARDAFPALLDVSPALPAVDSETGLTTPLCRVGGATAPSLAGPMSDSSPPFPPPRV